MKDIHQKIAETRVVYETLKACLECHPENKVYVNELEEIIDLLNLMEEKANELENN